MFAWFYKLLGKPVPYYANYPIWLIIWKPIRKLISVVIAPNIPFNSVRIALYKLVGYKIGKNVFIGMKCYMDDVDPHLTQIVDDVVISYAVKFAVHGKGQGHTPIIIEKGAYIGLGAILLSGKKGITIGENAIVGAGSVVTNSVKPGAVVVGVPARMVQKDEQ